MKNNKLKILVILGTRPETIKMAPLIKALKGHADKIECKVCVTGQHREMLNPLLEFFAITPDDHLDLMEDSQTLEDITCVVLRKAEEILKKNRPDYVMVQGDTTTSMAFALAAYYQKIKVAHVEAGLRTGNKLSPFPEEMNRKIIDDLSDVYFAHTEQAKENLVKEGVSEEAVEVTGNTVIDALLETAKQNHVIRATEIEKMPFETKKVILVTAHRRESFGEAFGNICRALKTIAEKYFSEIHIVYPVHLNPNVQKPVYSILDSIDNISLVEPLDYPDFVYCMQKAYFILSDSGGVQEEAPSLNKPVLVMRDATERPEAVEAGATRLVGTNVEQIVQGVSQLIDDQQMYQTMAQVPNPYGDGKASEKIVSRLLRQH